MPLTGEYEPSTSDWARSQAELYERSGGTEAAALKGRAIVVMPTVGARSGKLRKTALMRIEFGGEYAVVASRGGAPEHPFWYHNLLANPLAELQDGTDKRVYIAREVIDEEREIWWGRALAAFPPLAEYQHRTARVIPVLVLKPHAATRDAPSVTTGTELTIDRTRGIPSATRAIRRPFRRKVSAFSPPGSGWSGICGPPGPTPGVPRSCFMAVASDDIPGTALELDSPNRDGTVMHLMPAGTVTATGPPSATIC
jgi:deazaflavin-dependent oxidoreductase (nitroreductase family)